MVYDIISGEIYWGGPVGSLGDNIVRAKELKSPGRGSKTSVREFQPSGNGRKWVKPSKSEQGMGGGIDEETSRS
jgi:hypothetical protein